jgi:UDP-N-acetylmuramate dehydrogenase
VNELLKLAPATRLDEPLAPHCTMRVGGPCRALVRPESPAELSAAMTWLHKHDVPFKVVGKGANLLVSDEGYDGAIVILGQAFNWLERKDTALFSAGAGLSLASMCNQLARMGIAGFEFAAQIPGTVGGSLVNNAGAYGQDFTHLVQDATVIHADGTTETLPREKLELRYRGSKIKYTQNMCVVGATFAGTAGDPEEIRAKITEYGRHRAATQPVKDYTAGCVFKNPTDGKAGKLIESAGLKGTTVGRAIVSPKHANFIVNLGKATCQEVRDLIRKIQDGVHQRFSVELETEVEFVG